jgi:hypothetical protein
VTFSKTRGVITRVTNDNRVISFGNGLQPAGFNTGFKEMNVRGDKGNYSIELVYDSLMSATWTMIPGGMLRLDYQYLLNGSYDIAGITFTYPENLVTGAKLLANGPYRVWKNRLKGTQFGLYDKKYNNTVTGQSWDYPEFKGYYSNFYAVEIETKEAPVTIISATSDLFLHLFTPQTATNLRGVRGGMTPAFPTGNISIMNGISAVGTKFSKADEEGPQGQKNVYKTLPGSKPLSGTIYFKFGN